MDSSQGGRGELEYSDFTADRYINIAYQEFRQAVGGSRFQ